MYPSSRQKEERFTLPCRPSVRLVGDWRLASLRTLERTVLTIDGHRERMTDWFEGQQDSSVFKNSSFYIEKYSSTVGWNMDTAGNDS